MQVFYTEILVFFTVAANRSIDCWFPLQLWGPLNLNLSLNLTLWPVCQWNEGPKVLCRVQAVWGKVCRSNVQPVCSGALAAVFIFDLSTFQNLLLEVSPHWLQHWVLCLNCAPALAGCCVPPHDMWGCFCLLSRIKDLCTTGWFKEELLMSVVLASCADPMCGESPCLFGFQLQQQNKLLTSWDFCGSRNWVKNNKVSYQLLLGLCPRLWLFRIMLAEVFFLLIY